MGRETRFLLSSFTHTIFIRETGFQGVKIHPSRETRFLYQVTTSRQTGFKGLTGNWG
jgi:hypothetical protein